MKKLVIELCCVIVLAACGNGKEQNTVEEDSTAKNQKPVKKTSGPSLCSRASG